MSNVSVDSDTAIKSIRDAKLQDWMKNNPENGIYELSLTQPPGSAGPKWFISWGSRVSAFQLTKLRHPPSEG